jgi:hypothetical protein
VNYDVACDGQFCQLFAGRMIAVIVLLCPRNRNDGEIHRELWVGSLWPRYHEYGNVVERSKIGGKRFTTESEVFYRRSVLIDDICQSVDQNM